MHRVKVHEHGLFELTKVLVQSHQNETKIWILNYIYLIDTYWRPTPYVDDFDNVSNNDKIAKMTEPTIIKILVNAFQRF